MTNHPNRSAYARMLAKLDRISLDSKIAPDARRLANDASQRMRSAESRPTDIQVKSDASYFNLYGRDWQARMREDQEAASTERQSRMMAALDAATRFIEAWGL